jgi:hypothetical protein
MKCKVFPIKIRIKKMMIEPLKLFSMVKKKIESLGNPIITGETFSHPTAISVGGDFPPHGFAVRGEIF